MHDSPALGFRFFACLLVMVALCGGCTHLAYQPSKQMFSDPVKHGIRMESVTFTSSDRTLLKGWFFPASSKAMSPAPTVVQFHGNAENMTSHFFSVLWMTEAGYNVFAFDYRGYGHSEGHPDPAGVNRDAVAAMEFIQRKVPARQGVRDLVLYGQSLGGAVLARALEDLKDRSRISAVVIEGSFHSYQELAEDMLGRSWVTFLLQPLALLLVSDDHAPEGSFSRISPMPLLIIHGEKDHTVPLRFGRRIHELASAPKELWKIPGGHHIDAMWIDGGRHRRRLIQWLGAHRLK